MEEEEKILGSILGMWFLWNIQRELTNRSGAGGKQSYLLLSPVASIKQLVLKFFP